MPLRNWLPNPPLGVGLGVVALLAAASISTQYSHKGEREDSSAQQQLASTPRDVPRASIAPVGGIDPPPPEPKPKREEWRQESDLEAQWNMVWWAKVAAIVSGFGLAITGVGVVLVKQTLAANRAAVDAALAANAQQAKAVQLELRPYVAREGLVLHWMHTKGKPSELESWRVSLACKNAGQTPASNVRARVNVDTFPVDASPESTGYADVGNFDEVANPLGPSQSFASRLEVPLQKWIDAWEERKVLYCWAWIEYDGIQIDARHRTETCVKLIPQSDPSRKDDFKWTDIVATRFNALDGECVHKPKTSKDST
jgi:hypothetical protein